MTWLLFWFALEAAWLSPQAGFKQSFENQAFAIDFAARLYLLDEHFYVGGDVETQFIPCNPGFQFAPYTMIYTFEAGFKFKGLTLGIEHVCQHPVYVSHRTVKWAPETGSERLFLRFEGSQVLWRKR